MSFASNVTAQPGRVVVIVTDMESMTAGNEKLVRTAPATSSIGSGLRTRSAFWCSPARASDLTRDHQQVRQVLRLLRGFRSAGVGRHMITIAEAEGYARKDQLTIDQVIDREVRRGETVCPPELEREARFVLMEADRRIETVLSTLAALNANLQRVEGPKSIVVLSAGLPFRQSTLSYFRELERRSAEAGTSLLQVVQLEQPENDASRRTSGGNLLPRSDLMDGLSNVAGFAGGAFFHGVGTAAGVFDRIHTQVVHTYQLGIESTPGDGDGKVHKVEVQVRRDGAVTPAPAAIGSCGPQRRRR